MTKFRYSEDSQKSNHYHHHYHNNHHQRYHHNDYNHQRYHHSDDRDDHRKINHNDNHRQHHHQYRNHNYDELRLASIRDVVYFVKESSVGKRKIHHSDLHKILSILKTSNDIMTMIDISICMFHMKLYSITDSYIRELLVELTSRINKDHIKLSSQSVGNILNGLKNMSGNEHEVRGMLRVLVPKIKDCKEILSAQEVGLAISGLQNMSSDVKEVREILQQLIPKIRECRYFDCQAIGNSLYSMKNMDSDVEEVRGILRELVPKIRGTIIIIIIIIITNIIIIIIIKDVKDCSQITSQEVGNSLYGLQNMSSDVKEVREILQHLIPKIKQVRYLDCQAISW